MSDTFWGISTYMHFNIPCSWSDIIIIFLLLLFFLLLCELVTCIYLYIAS